MIFASSAVGRQSKTDIMGKIYVGFNGIDLFHAATTKTGLAKLIGVSTDTVSRSLKVDCRVKKGYVWHVGEVDLVKVGGIRGKLRSGGGFLGFKGADGLKKGSKEGFKVIE